MSVTPVAEGDDLSPAPKTTPELPLTAIFFFLTLLVVLFLPVIKPMVTEWVNDEDMGHALFVPVVAGYIVWLERKQILATPVKPCWPAVAVIVWGFCQMVLGFLGAEFFTARLAFVISIAGVVWTLAGTAVLRKVAFPLFLLLFMLRIPLFLYQALTFPLQLLASNVAAHALDLIGIPVLLNGNVLDLGYKKLEVVEACSGIRSLLSLTFLAVAYGRLFETRLWMKIVLFLSTIPIAIACNAFRVTLTGILTVYKPEIAEGAYHSFEGWVIFLVEMGVFLGFHRLLCRFAHKAPAPPAAPAPAV